MKYFTRLITLPVTRMGLLYPIAYMGMIYLLSEIQGGSDTKQVQTWWTEFSPLLFNFMHIPLYAGLAWTWRWALTAWGQRAPFLVTATFLLTTGYGVVDEWHQSYVPGRESSLSDILLDMLGASLALTLFYLAESHAKMEPKTSAHRQQ